MLLLLLCDSKTWIRTRIGHGSALKTCFRVRSQIAILVLQCLWLLSFSSSPARIPDRDVPRRNCHFLLLCQVSHSWKNNHHGGSSFKLYFLLCSSSPLKGRHFNRHNWPVQLYGFWIGRIGTPAMQHLICKLSVSWTANWKREEQDAQSPRGNFRQVPSVNIS